MEKIMNRASESSKKYNRSQRERGLALVRVWVPAEAKEKVIALANNLRGKRKRGSVLVSIWVPTEAKEKVVALGERLRKLK